MTDLSVTQVRQMRAAVLGATARAPGALIGLGSVFVILGMIGVAGQTLYSFVSVNILGAFLIFGGVLQLAHALKSHCWKSVGIQLLFAILCFGAGFYTWAFPIPALEVITLWLAIIFFATGFLRLISVFQHRQFAEWFWLMIFASISMLMGALIISDFPSSSLWLPGLLIAIELLIQGWPLFFLGIPAFKLSKG